MDHPIHELPEPSCPADIIHRASLCRLVITGSYHAGVFALSQGIPVIGLYQSDYYSDKFKGLAEQFSHGCVAIDLKSLNCDQHLLSEVKRLWNEADHLRESLLKAAESQIYHSKQAYDRFMNSLHSARLIK